MERYDLQFVDGKEAEVSFGLTIRADGKVVSANVNWRDEGLYHCFSSFSGSLELIAADSEEDRLRENNNLVKMRTYNTLRYYANDEQGCHYRQWR